MASLTFFKLIPERNQTFTANPHLSIGFKKINPLIHFSSIHFPHFFPKISLHNHNSHFQLCFSQRSHAAHDFFDNTHSFVTKVVILLTFSFALLSLRIVSTILVPQFPQRWTRLIAFSKRAELEVMSSCPQHLIEAVVAYEDRRFFHHFGVDPVGVARAVLSLSSLGGGSTITQQLVKNSFLKNERTFLRKIVEMILALALEGTISKMEILSAYLCKIYWGHGIYGIQSASKFYFGKHISLLSLGECAMLAAMIPAPELRSPFRDSSRGKTFQARVLKRMVEFGFLDVDMAGIAVKQPLILNSGSPDHSDGLLVISASSQVHSGMNTTCDRGLFSTIKRIWDWETESKIWEVKEDMERWATGVKRLGSINGSQVQFRRSFFS
ncbi:PREDICTED: uncharacterized protein LOC109238821 isoform X1 [Nicotiana attenuata]|nr:PREDICTED: uncharacterized protein LOC109238821 isoform X1 [Nicotiana attenuata]XP_019260848.1 PREDICTED: uncharacterized protein LOC109238821 isoform X1 [Nicotiana attenuata]